VARYGGEDFVVVLPDSDLQSASKKLDRLREKLSIKAIPITPQQNLTITFSAGITQWMDDQSLDNVLNQADELLYVAKHNGRNRVVTPQIQDSIDEMENNPPGPKLAK
ncbi:GGDEF domain-containing protein, partial [Vibrio sp.]|uniref:GGDEF domain-containing protein n=1 Tax=Vibrio sp. TaxID=678 RepID=UPI003D104B72